jgi:outer membrane protein insertion porin family
MRILSRALSTLLLLAPLSVTLPVHAQSYTIAAIVFTHPGPYTSAELLTASGLSPEALQEFNKAWQMKPGDVYNPTYVSNFIHSNTALPHLARYAGTFQASADPTTHLVDLTLAFFPYNGQ